MKLTVNQLRQIIKEEVSKVVEAGRKSAVMKRDYDYGRGTLKKGETYPMSGGKFSMTAGHGESYDIPDSEYDVVDMPTSPRAAGSPGTFAHMKKEFSYNYYGPSTVKPGSKIKIGRGGSRLLPSGDLEFVLGHGVTEIIPASYFDVV